MKKIGIIGAMDNEVRTLIQMMDIEKTVDKASLKFYIGKLEGKRHCFSSMWNRKSKCCIMCTNINK